MGVIRTIDDAIASLCDDICSHADAVGNKTRAEAVVLLAAANRLYTPAPQELTWRKAVKVLHDTCREVCNNNADCGDCPMLAWCDQAIPESAMRPEMWEVSDD